MSVWAKTWAYEQHPLQLDAELQVVEGRRNPAGKSVLGALAEWANGEGWCCPAQETLAAMTDLGERTVRWQLKVLEHQGIIKREPRYITDEAGQTRRTSDGYTLQAPAHRLRPVPAGAAARTHAIPAGAAGRTYVPAGAAGEPTLLRSGEQQAATPPSTVPAGKHFVTVLMDALNGREARDQPMRKPSGQQRTLYGRHAKEAVAHERATVAQAEAAMQRIAERSGELWLRFDMALEDAQAGRTGRPGAVGKPRGGVYRGNKPGKGNPADDERFDQEA